MSHSTLKRILAFIGLIIFILLGTWLPWTLVKEGQAIVDNGDGSSCQLSP